MGPKRKGSPKAARYLSGRLLLTVSLVPVHKHMFLLAEVGCIGTKGGVGGHWTAFAVGEGLHGLDERKSSMGDGTRRSARLAMPWRTDRVRSI